MRVSVVGGGETDESTGARAETVGRLLAERGHTLFTGGRGGVMAAASRGASAAGGRTVGILPGTDPSGANDHVDVAVATGLGDARNALVVLNADAVIAVDGGPGTLSELGYAGVYDRPTAGLDTWALPWVRPVDSPAAAVAYVEEQAGGE
jgi:hypothetical protein